MIRELEARELRVGMTARVGGRYRELTHVGRAFEGEGIGRAAVLVITIGDRGYRLELNELVRVRPTDRGAAM